MKKYIIILIGIWMVVGHPQSRYAEVFAQEEPDTISIEDFANGPTGWVQLIGEPGKRVSIQQFTDDQFPKGAAEVFFDSTGNNYLALIKQVSGFPLDVKFITLWVRGTGKKEEIWLLLSTGENKNYFIPVKLDNSSWHKVRLPISEFVSMDTKEPLAVYRTTGVGFFQLSNSSQKNFWVAQIYAEGRTSREIEQENESQYRYTEGLKLYEQRKYDLAFIEWDKALVLDPKNEEMRKEIVEKKVAFYSDNGMNFYKEGKVALAVEEWEKVLKLDPGNTEIIELINETTAPPVAVIDDFEEVKFIEEYNDRVITEGGWFLASDQGKKGLIKWITDEQFPRGAAEISLGRIEGGNLAIAKFISQTIWGKDMDRLTMWIKGNGADNEVMVALITELRQGGEKIYISSISMKDINWHKVNLKLANFIPLNTKEPLLIRDVKALGFFQKAKAPPVRFRVAQIHTEMKSAREIRIENEIREYYNAGLSLYKEGRYASAVAEWEKVLVLEPDNQKIRALVQEAKQKVGTTFDEKRAQASYDKGLDAYNKGDYKTARELLKEATAFWTKVVESDPQNLPAVQNLKSAKHLLRKIEVENEVRLHIQKEQEFLQNKDYQFAVVEYNIIDTLCQSILKDEPGEEKISKLRKEASGYLASIGAEMEAKKSLEQARDYYKKKQLTEAALEIAQSITSLKRILEKEPSNSRAKETLVAAMQLLELINLEKEIWVRLSKSALFHQTGNYAAELSEFAEANSLCLKAIGLDTANLRIIDIKDKLKLKVEQTKLEKEASEHYDSGLKLYQKGDYASGIQEFNRTIQLWQKALVYEPQATRPAQGIQMAKFQIEKTNLESEIKAHQNKGQELQLKEDYEKAINEYESANTLCLRILSRERENKKIQDLRLQIQCSLSFVKGISFYKNGKYAEAILEWKQVLSLNPKYPDVQSWIDKTTQKEKKKAEVDVVNKQTFEQGMRYYNQEEYTKAIAEWKKVIAKDPNYPEVQEYYKKAVEKLTIEKETKLSRAREYNKNGDLVKAVREWRAVLRMDPSDKESSEYLQKLKTRISEKANSLYLEGINYYMKEDLEKAISIWEDVLILDPGNEKARKNIEKARTKLKK